MTVKTGPAKTGPARQLATAMHFGYPKPLQPVTTLVIEDGEPELLTARNDGLVNSFKLTLCSCLHGGPMLTCSTVYHVTRSLNTVQSLQLSVNLGPS